MRVFSCMIFLALLCVTTSGCSLFKKNTNTTQGPMGGGATPPKFPGVNDPLLNSNIPSPPTLPTAPLSTPPATQTSGQGGATILAGTVTDAYHRPVGNAYIRWVNLDEKDAGAPIDVAADSSGHFIIQGLKPGASYKLIARTKFGEKMFAGVVLTSAPNVRVIIPIREDLANSDTPPIPGSPAYQPADGSSGKGQAPNTGALNKSTQTPDLPATVTLPGPPTNTQVGNPAASAGNPAFVPGVVEGPPKDRLPMLSIPNQTPRQELPALPGDSKLDTGPTRVPSCVLLGNRLENLALKDSKGQTWEYKKQGAGKLVLIDFWGTHCLLCRDSMPTLNRLHQLYASRGLEVVGIALEKGADERREADAVNKMCASMKVSYRQLMGHVGAFDVGTRFRIEGVPTLILLDDQGNIIWHHVGRPDPSLLDALERTIHSRLDRRKF